MQSVILAGGKGTRLRPLTIHTPKPVVPIVNRPFLTYQIELLKRAQVSDITLSLSYQPGRIKEIYGDGEDHGVRIHYAVESSPLGTAGAYKNAEEHLRQTAIVFNGDVLTDMDLEAIVAFHREKKAAATLVLVPVKDVSAFGVVETEPDGRVRRFVEKPKAGETDARTINAGCYILEPHILKYVPKDESFSFEYQLFPALLAAGEPVYAYVWNGYWLDIGVPQRYLDAHYDLMAGKVKLFDVRRDPLPAFTGEGEAPSVDGLSVIDPSCAVKSGVQVINSVIGPNCIIEDRARIENSVIQAGSRIGVAAEIRNSVVGRSGLIGRNVIINNALLGDKTSLTDYTVC